MKIFAAMLVLIACGVANAQFAADDAGARENARKIAERATEGNLQKYASDAHVMVKPGVLADRGAKRITLWGAATGLESDEPCEFFLIHDRSGKDYESLAITYARPSDVDEALRFIGMAPGRPVDYGRLMFWPKGERVVMRLQWTDEAGASHDVRVEELVRDLRTGKAMEQAGLVYVGSRWIERVGAERVMAADSGDVGSIASTYNEPTTLLDVPRRAEQGAVYGVFKANGDYALTKYHPVTITIVPERTEGLPRVIDVAVVIGASEFRLVDAAGVTLNGETTLAGVLAAFGDLSEQGRDVFVSVVPGRAAGVTLRDVQRVAKVLDAIETEDGIRVEPPAKGHLYYRAFLPAEEWRDRTGRTVGGWELHVTAVKDGSLELRLLEIHSGWDGRDRPVITETMHEARDAESLANVLSEIDGNRPRNLYVFAPGELEYGRLCGLLKEVLKKPRTIYVLEANGP